MADHRDPDVDVDDLPGGADALLGPVRAWVEAKG